MHKELSLSTARNYVYDCPISTTYLSITNNETWDFDIKVYRDIVIEPNNTLIIQCNVLMQSFSKIKIKPGAKLIIDGGIVTNGCDNGLWQGIELWGNTNQNQVPVNGIYQQGIVQIINGGTIENAVCGIVTAAFDASNGKEILGMHGGIILADNAVFKNCRTAVDFREYHNMLNGNEIANFSYFNL